MKSNGIATTVNPDLVVAEGGRTKWNTPETRRGDFTISTTSPATGSACGPGDFIVRAPGALHTGGSKNGALVLLIYSE